jgi:hypothetical protein
VITLSCYNCGELVVHGASHECSAFTDKCHHPEGYYDELTKQG